MQGSFGSNEPHLQRQDIKTMIDSLNSINTCAGFEDHIINNAITMLEDLGNLVSKLQEEKKTQKEYYEVVFNDGANRIKNLMEENTSLKQELKDINKAIDDPAVDLTLTASECILKIKKDIINLKHEIIHLEAMIDD